MSKKIYIENDAVATLSKVYTKKETDAKLAEKVNQEQLEAAISTVDTEIDSKLALKQDKLTAGENITINGNVISATGGGGDITVDVMKLTVAFPTEADQSEVVITEEQYNKLLDTDTSTIIRITDPDSGSFIDLYSGILLSVPQFNLEQHAYYSLAIKNDDHSYRFSALPLEYDNNMYKLVVAKMPNDAIYNTDIQAKIKEEISPSSWSIHNVPAGQVLTADGDGNTIWAASVSETAAIKQTGSIQEETGQYYYTPRAEGYFGFEKNAKLSDQDVDTLRIDTHAISEELSNLTYQTSDHIHYIMTYRDPTPSTSGSSFNILFSIYQNNDATEYIGNIITYPVLATELKNSSRQYYGATFYYDDEGWIYQWDKGDGSGVQPIDVVGFLKYAITEGGLDSSPLYYIDDELTSAITSHKVIDERIYKSKDNKQLDILDESSIVIEKGDLLATTVSIEAGKHYLETGNSIKNYAETTFTQDQIVEDDLYLNTNLDVATMTALLNYMAERTQPDEETETYKTYNIVNTYEEGVNPNSILYALYAMHTRQNSQSSEWSWILVYAFFPLFTDKDRVMGDSSHTVTLPAGWNMLTWSGEVIPTPPDLYTSRLARKDSATKVCIKNKIVADVILSTTKPKFYDYGSIYYMNPLTNEPEKILRDTDLAGLSIDYNSINNKPIINQVKTVELSGPIAVNDTFTTGTLIHFDKTKSSELETYLNSFSPESSNYINLIQSQRAYDYYRNGFSLWVCSPYRYDTSVQSGRVLAIEDGNDKYYGEGVIIYTDIDFTYRGTDYKAGNWYNLDEFGNYSIKISYTSDSIREMTANISQINGQVVGYPINVYIPAGKYGEFYRRDENIYKCAKEGHLAGYNKFSVGDKLNSSSLIKFDRTTGGTAAVDAFLSACPSMTMFLTAGSYSSYMFMLYVLSDTNDSSKRGLLLIAGNASGSPGYYPLYATDDFTFNQGITISFTQGWNDTYITQDGQLDITIDQEIEVSEITQESLNWNGTIISQYVTAEEDEYKKVLLEGEVVTETYRPFNPSWRTDSSISSLGYSIAEDATATVGMVYEGTTALSNLPSEISGQTLNTIVEILSNDSNGKKVVRITLVSKDTAPYTWEYLCWRDGNDHRGLTAYIPTSYMETSISQSDSKIPTSNAVYTALSGKQDILTLDNVPSSSSNNPVKSKGIYTVTLGYTISGTVTSGDTISDTDAIDALTNNYPITVNGKKFEYQHTNSTIKEYVNTCLDNSDIKTVVMTFDTSDNTMVFVEQAASGGVQYTTTEPTADNMDGDLKFVVLSTDPATKYNGYLYYITD